MRQPSEIPAVGSIWLPPAGDDAKKDDTMTKGIDPRLATQAPETRGGAARRARSAALVLVAAFAGLAVSAYPQAAQAAPTATTIATNVTAPRGGVVLVGANGSSHYWFPDHLLGFCRLDPSAASPTGFAINRTTCVLFVGGAPKAAQIKAAQASYDPKTNFVYVPDMASRSVGIVRLHFDPHMDGGNGGMSILHRTTFGPSCLGLQLPWGSAFGPDGNLYLSFKRSPQIVRVVNPHLTPTCANVEWVGNASDGKSAMALAFVGPDLWEADNVGLGVISGATDAACTAGACDSFPLFTGEVALPAALASDELNQVLYVGDATGIHALDVNNGSGPVLYQPISSFVFGLAVDPKTLIVGGAPTLFGGADPSRGILPLTGSLFRVLP